MSRIGPQQPFQAQPANAHNLHTLDDIKRKIRIQDYAIKSNPNNADLQHKMGKLKGDLASLTRTDTDYRAAIMHLDMAIELESGKAIFRCDRAKLHAFFNEKEKAVRDLEAINNLRQSQEGEPEMHKAYVLNTMTDLARLKGVKETIEDLGARGELSQEFLTAFESLRQVTEGLVRKVDDHDKHLEEVDNTLSEMKKIQRVTQDEMKQIFQIAEGLGVKVDVQEQKLEEHKKQLDGHKETLEDHKERLDNHEHTLDLSGVKNLANLKEQFNNLKSDHLLYIYATTFYWAAENLLGAYQHLSTGQVASGDEQGLSEAFAMEGVKQVVSAATEFMKAVPIVGGIFGFTDMLVDKVFDWVESKKLQERCDIINKIIRKNCQMKDGLSLMAGKVALVFVRNEHKIEMIRKKASQQTQTSQSWYSTKWEKFAKGKWPGVEREPAAMEAMKDVTVIFAYLIVKHEDILKSNEDLDVQIENTLKNDRLEQMLAGLGINGLCRKCQKAELVPRIGKKPAACVKCKQENTGGVKCPSCDTKHCRNCSKYA